MQVSNSVLIAVNTVLDLDMPDAAYPEAFNAQVCLITGLEPEHACGFDVDWPVH